MGKIYFASCGTRYSHTFMRDDGSTIEVPREPKIQMMLPCFRCKGTMVDVKREEIEKLGGVAFKCFNCGEEISTSKTNPQIKRRII